MYIKTMGLLQKLLKGGNKKEFKAKFKAVQEEDRIMEMVEERKKSANRRELERYMKEQEEAQIKEALNKINKERNKENWSSKKKILDGGTSILKDDRPILQEKNIFMNNPKLFKANNKNSMGFFK